MKIGKFEINKKIFILLIIVIVLSIISLIVKNNTGEEKYNKCKIDKDKDYIYTYKNYKDSSTYIPYINIKNNFVNNLNKEIKKLGNTYKDSKTKNNSMDYGVNKYGNMLSIVLVFKTLENNELQFNFKTYVFDLADHGRVLTDTEILNIFNISTDDVKNKINSTMSKKYKDEITKEIIPNTCSYNTCYLKLRKIDNFLNNVNYFVEDGKLIVYRSFNAYSTYHEEEYFTRDDFRFVIK